MGAGCHLLENASRTAVSRPLGEGDGSTAATQAPQAWRLVDASVSMKLLNSSTIMVARTRWLASVSGKDSTRLWFTKQHAVLPFEVTHRDLMARGLCDRYVPAMDAQTTHGKLAAQTRQALGLTQAQMARLLGIAPKSLTRLETKDEEWPPALQRVIRLLLECRLSDLERTLVALHDGLSMSESPPAEHESLAAHAHRTVRANGDARRDGRDRVRDLVGRLHRPTAWVYWANGARADAANTLAMADAGILCRPLLDALGNRPDYLARLAPGQRILLCHNGEPLRWYKLRKSRRKKFADFPALPPVLRFVKADSALGRRLRDFGYRTQRGSIASSPGELFSCLAVFPLKDALVHPEARGRGVRDAMTPFRAGQGAT